MSALPVSSPKIVIVKLVLMTDENTFRHVVIPADEALQIEPKVTAITKDELGEWVIHSIWFESYARRMQKSEELSAQKFNQLFIPPSP